MLRRSWKLCQQEPTILLSTTPPPVMGNTQIHTTAGRLENHLEFKVQSGIDFVIFPFPTHKTFSVSAWYSLKNQCFHKDSNKFLILAQGIGKGCLSGMGVVFLLVRWGTILSYHSSSSAL